LALGGVNVSGLPYFHEDLPHNRGERRVRPQFKPRIATFRRKRNLHVWSAGKAKQIRRAMSTVNIHAFLLEQS
jgi:hypothetical protein